MIKKVFEEKWLGVPWNTKLIWDQCHINEFFMRDDTVNVEVIWSSNDKSRFTLNGGPEVRYDNFRTTLHLCQYNR